MGEWVDAGRKGGVLQDPPKVPVAMAVAGLAAHLKTARWVCSLSSPFTMQENSPKDSVPVEKKEEAAVGLEGSSHPTAQGTSPTSAHPRGLGVLQDEGSRGLMAPTGQGSPQGIPSESLTLCPPPS